MSISQKRQAGVLHKSGEEVGCKRRRKKFKLFSENDEIGKQLDYVGKCIIEVRKGYKFLPYDV